MFRGRTKESGAPEQVADEDDAEIDDAQARQLAFDLDAAYAEFHRGLKDAS